MRNLTRRPGPRAGAAMIEMALVLPVLILLVFGAIEYGWVFLKESQVNNAARQGARAGVRPDADAAEVQAAVTQVMNQAGLGGSGYQVTITNLNAPVGGAVTVQVSLTYANISLVGGLVPRPSQIRGAATLAKEGP